MGRRSWDPSKIAPAGWLALVLVGVMAAELPAAPATVPAGAPTIQPASDDADSDAEGVQPRGIFATPDRSLVRLLGKARQLVDEDRYAEAVRCLGAILDSPEDYFFQPDRHGPVHRSLKSEAQRLIGELPRQGRELYELQYGAQARHLLIDAAASGDAFELAEVSRRFFHTQAGYEATLLLGIHHLSQGRPLGAALVLERLREAGPDADRFEPTLSTMLAACWIRCDMPDKAWYVLAKLKERYAGDKVTIAGKEVPLFTKGLGSLELPITEKQALALLADGENPLGRLAKLVGSPPPTGPQAGRQWTMLRGNPARTAAASGSAPLMSLRWRVPTTLHPYVEALVDVLHQDDEDRGQEVAPGLHPLAVDNFVLMRTARNLLAVDFNTGKRLWEVPVDDPFEAFLNAAPGASSRPTAQLGFALRMRMWGDATYGTLSSDGQLVFAVEDLGLSIGPINVGRMFINPTGRQLHDHAECNRLAAYDIRTGKLKWHLGGVKEDLGLPEAGDFFLGPPLPLMKQLFVLAENKGEIRLLALDAGTGDLLWSQQLADAERGVLLDPLRRFAGASPSYADGVLVCPTCNRAIVAIELTTRSLLWGYTYGPRDDGSDRPPMLLGMRQVADLDPSVRWTDSSLTLADGCVLATPPDSQEIHCLNLIDGSPLWTQPRDDDLYLACVHSGNVVLVGRHRVRALKLDDGQAAWGGHAIPLPEGSSPNGTGFLAGGLYFVPLSTAEVLAVDVDAGRVAYVSKSRHGDVPGNLICYKDKIISQRADAVEVFYQVDALSAQVDRRLAANPKDADALALEGEILWHEGKLDEAIRACRRSLELVPDPGTRQLLREACFEGLQTDFPRYRKDIERIEDLVDTDGQRATLLRLLVTGFQSAGELDAALKSCLELIDVDRRSPALEPLDARLSVRRDRWIQTKLAELATKGPAEIRTELDAAAEARLKSALEDKSPKSLVELLDYFGGHRIAHEARSRLIGRLRQSGHLLAAELLLREQAAGGGKKSDVAAAVAELADMLHEAGRWEDAAACYVRLESEFADVVCREGKTGKQLCSALAADDPTRRAMEPKSPWPVGNVEVTTSVPERSPTPSYLTAPIEFHGSPAPFLSDFEIELTPNPPALVGRDGWGDAQWQLSLAELAHQQGFFMNRNLIRAAAYGHLLLLRTGNTVTGVDLLGDGKSRLPRVLWSRDLDDPTDATPESDNLTRLAAGSLPGGARAWYVSRGFRTAIPYPLIASEQLICMMRLRSCVGLDPATGETLWVRHNLPADSELFGDRQYVFVVPPEDNAQHEATVLRAADGQLVGTRPLAPEGERLAAFGRQVLVWHSTGTHRVLDLVDAWDQKSVWPPLEFSADAQLDLKEREKKAAVLEPGGRFVLVDLDDGRTVIDATVEPEPRLAGMVVVSCPDQYMLVTQATESPADRKPNQQVLPVHATRSVKIARGRVYAFDRHGKPLWKSPVAIEDCHLLLDQPRRLPVLTFASMVRERNKEGHYETGISLLAIDKRNGRKVLDTTLDGPTNSFRIVGDPSRKTVVVELRQNTIEMKFTDKPLPADTEQGEKEANSKQQLPSTSIEALWSAIRKATFGPPLGPAEPSPPPPSQTP